MELVQVSTTRTKYYWVLGYSGVIPGVMDVERGVSKRLDSKL